MKKRLSIIVFCFTLILLLCACASPAPATQEANASAATPAAVSDDAKPEPTAVPEPTATPEPTEVPAPTLISTEVTDEYTYEVYSDDTAIITECRAMGPELTLPDKLGGYEVVGIAEFAFMDWNYNYGVDVVTIPGTVRDIAPSAFLSCYIYELRFSPESTEYIFEDGALLTADRTVLIAYLEGRERARAVSSYTVPASVKEIAAYAFCGNTRIDQISLPEGLTRIGEYAFTSTAFQELVIPASVTEIGAGAFVNVYHREDRLQFAPGNTTYVLEDGVLYSADRTLLHSCLFADTKKEFTVPEGVTVICDEAFNGEKKLEKINLPESLMRIGARAFEWCEVKDVNFPGGLTQIGRNAFAFTKMTSITFPDGLTEIGEEAFFGCENLTGVDIPGSVKRIDTEAFRGCNAVTDVTIGEGVTSVGDRAFGWCEALKSVTIPASVTEIGTDAFTGLAEGYVIHCPAGSYAETYATENNLNFVND